MAIASDQASIGSASNISGSTTIAFNTTATVSAGGFIVLGVGWWESTTITVSSVSGGGLTWTIDKQGHQSSANPATAIISAQAPSGLASGTTITVTYSGSTRARMVGGMSLTGVATSSPVDTTGTTQSANAAGWSTGSVAIAAGSVLFGCSFNESASASTPTAPATEVFDLTVSSNGTTLAYQIQASAGSYSTAGTWNVSGQNVTNSVAYLAAAGGGGGGGAAQQFLTMVGAGS